MSIAAEDTTTRVLPYLESGDRLTRAEFERRYEQMPRHVKAELIEGVVYIPSPVRIANHGTPRALVLTWLGYFWSATPGTHLVDNGTVRLDLDNEVQPDALLRVDEAHGGQSRISGDDYLEGPPELAAEIAASTAAYDLHDKLHVYRRNAVQEYIVWTMYPRRIQWFRLEEGAYVPLAAGDDGIIRSRVFPGLWLDGAALLADKLPRCWRCCRRGSRRPSMWHSSKDFARGLPIPTGSPDLFEAGRRQHRRLLRLDDRPLQIH